MSAQDWRQRGACRDEDPETFFETGTGPVAKAQIEEAKAICARCGVVDECLDWAIESGQRYGVAGGMSDKERRAESLRRKAIQAVTP